jgi:hypothetical protein
MLPQILRHKLRQHHDHLPHPMLQLPHDHLLTHVKMELFVQKIHANTLMDQEILIPVQLVAENGATVEDVTAQEDL